MPTARLRKVGGSVMVPIPPALLSMTRLAAGSVVEISVNGDVLEIKSARPRFTLDELLDGSDYTQDSKDREWLDAPPTGHELL